jgi:nucleotide-binding universal stress UspA family protein
MKTLLAVDGSEYTQRMLKYVSEHRHLLGDGAQVSVLTVVPKVPPYATRHISASDIEGHYQETAQPILKPIADFLRGQGIVATVRHEAGSPADVIASVATTGQYDLLVMGSHGHGSLGSLVMGSVATGVLARCQTPVLLIR